MKVILQPGRDEIVTQATVPVGDVFHHFRVVRDGDRAEDVYAFLWGTTPGEGEPVEWGEHWRGNLRACLRNFAEVVEDMAAEGLASLAAEVNAR